MARVTDKAQMYRLLAAGEFGNTVPQFFSVEEWLASGLRDKYGWWGVRSLIVGGPCRLYCPNDEVAETVRGFACPCNISLMIDAVTRIALWADVYDSPTGLVVYGIEYPPEGGSWRALMPTCGRQREGVAAKMLLRKHLNSNSLADVEEVFECYPEHVLELSACERCVGLVPLRNHVVWEVRAY